MLYEVCDTAHPALGLMNEIEWVKNLYTCRLMSMPAITSASKLGAIAQAIKSAVYTPFY